MIIDEKLLTTERESLVQEFETLSTKIKSVDMNLAQMKGNLNALNGAIQQTDKLIKLGNQTDEKI